MASEFVFAPAGGVRSFPEGWYWTGTPFGVGVWSFRLVLSCLLILWEEADCICMPVC